ncbi:MAG: FAD:protein FMN transferase [Planctomycetia bacterium]
MTISAWHRIWGICIVAIAQFAQIRCQAPILEAADLATFAGPAMGTTYRVTLARDVAGMSLSEVHREVEEVLARLDRALSTWRDDSDASRFNRACPGEWVTVASDLVAIVSIARRVHDDTGGAFDITAGVGRTGGMRDFEIRPAPPALHKTRAGVVLDLGGIGPGYAVDRVGEELVALGSTAHLVELGGEVRAWGTRADGSPWRVAERGSRTVLNLADGEAVATSTARPGKSPIDPRTGRTVEACALSVTVRAATCAEADARAVAKLVLEATHPAAGRNHEE